jgi:hypothetical protein
LVLYKAAAFPFPLAWYIFQGIVAHGNGSALMLTLPNRGMIWQTAQVGFSARRAAGDAAQTVVRVSMNAAGFLPRSNHDDQRS